MDYLDCIRTLTAKGVCHSHRGKRRSWSTRTAGREGIGPTAPPEERDRSTRTAGREGIGLGWGVIEDVRRLIFTPWQITWGFGGQQ